MYSKMVSSVPLLQPFLYKENIEQKGMQFDAPKCNKERENVHEKGRFELKCWSFECRFFTFDGCLPWRRIFASHVSPKCYEIWFRTMSRASYQHDYKRKKLRHPNTPFFLPLKKIFDFTKIKQESYNHFLFCILVSSRIYDHVVVA